MKSILLALVLAISSLACNGADIRIKTTAYTHTEKDHIKYKSKTALGTPLGVTSAASDWSVFPAGTILLIDNKRYVITDYGSALVKPVGATPVVDIYQPSKSAMRRWGVKFFDIKVLKWGNLKASADILKTRLRYRHCRIMYERIISKIRRK
jgi:3D (Asp-Asp-Asp) domain-containing protein